MSWFVCPNITVGFCFLHSLTWQPHTSKGFLVVMSKILREALLCKSILWKLLFHTDIVLEPWTPGCVIYFNVTRQVCPIRLDNCPRRLGLGSSLWVGDLWCWWYSGGELSKQYGSQTHPLYWIQICSGEICAKTSNFSASGNVSMNIINIIAIAIHSFKSMFIECVHRGQSPRLGNQEGPKMNYTNEHYGSFLLEGIKQTRQDTSELMHVKFLE